MQRYCRVPMAAKLLGLNWWARIRWSSLNVIAWLAFDPWGRWFPGSAAVAQCTVWSLCVLVYPPFFDEDTRLLHGVEDFTDE